MRLFHILLPIIFSFLLSSFAAAQSSINAPRPVETTASTEIEGAISTIPIPLSISLSSVQGLLDQTFPNDQVFLRSGIPVKKDITLQIDLRKTASFRIEPTGNGFRVAMPLIAFLRVDVDKLFGDDFNTAVRFTAFASFQPSIDKNYIFQPGLSLDYRLDRGAVIKIGPIEINLVSRTREAIEKQLNTLGPKLNNIITAKTNLKQYAQESWDFLSKSHLIDEKLGIYAWAEPLQFLSIPFKTKDGDIELGMGVQGKFFAGILEEPPTLLPVTPLPPFSGTPAGEQFSLNVPITVEYDQIEKLLLKEFSGRRFEVSGHEVELHKFTVFGGRDNKLVIGVNATFHPDGGVLNTKGWVYFTGTPIYDPETNSISISDLDYDVQTLNVLVGALIWAADPIIAETLQENTLYDLTDDFSNVQREVHKRNPFVVADGANLFVQVNKVGVHSIRVGRKNLVINASAGGQSLIQVDGAQLR